MKLLLGSIATALVVGFSVLWLTMPSLRGTRSQVPGSPATAHRAGVRDDALSVTYESKTEREASERQRGPTYTPPQVRSLHLRLWYLPDQHRCYLYDDLPGGGRLNVDLEPQVCEDVGFKTSPAPDAR